MIPLESLLDAKARVYTEAQDVISNIHDAVADRPTNGKDAIALLGAIRSEFYEDLNQLQHEYLIIQGAGWLLENDIVTPDVSWWWNPRQTGTADEPDLAAKNGDEWLVSAEATTSVEPKGQIDARMASTLLNLSDMPGERFYFVRSPAMRSRAETKIGKAGWEIQVVYFDLPTVQLF